MKVLYISNFLDNTGWSHAAIDHALALDSVGVEVVCRHIKLNNQIGEIPDRLQSLLQGSLSGCDYTIQCVLPHMCEFDGHFKKNIVQYYTETDNFISSGWPSKINTMDGAWVASKQSLWASLNSGVDKKLTVIPCATDITRFQKSYPSHQMRDIIGDNFVFYTIGETNRRKNLMALLKAFHTEFHPEEPVQLFIKTTPVGIQGPEELLHITDEIKTHLKMYPAKENYKDEMVVAEFWKEEQIMSLHKSADCFVSTSFGEGWSIPAFDAMASGNPVIAPKYGGFVEYLNEDNSWLIDGHLEPVVGMHTSLPNLYSGRENWFNVDVIGLRKAMRECYQNKAMRDNKGIAGMKRAYDFTYEKVGKIMKEKLESF